MGLKKYKSMVALSRGLSIPPTSPNPPVGTQTLLSELWEKYSQFKQPQVSPSTYAKDFTKHRNHISNLPSKALEDAALIRDHLLASLTPDSAKRCLTQIKACCTWAVEEGLIESNTNLV